MSAAPSTIGVAIDIPEPWGSELTARRAAAGDPVAAYVPAHVTLLGPTPLAGAHLVPALDEYLAALAGTARPFRMLLRGTGTFRPVTQVVFVAVAAGIDDCERLHDAVLAAPMIEREEKFPYLPHVTVAHDVATERLDGAFADLADFEAAFQVRTFTLFEHDSGGWWRPYREYPLLASRAAHRRR